MINDDDLYVVIVDDTGNGYKPGKKTKTEPETSYLEIENDWIERKYYLEKENKDEVEDILKVAQKHGEILQIEEDDEDFKLDYDTENDSILNDYECKPVNIIYDGDRSSADSDEDNEALIIQDINWRRRTTDSFVQKLKTKFPDLRYNNEYVVMRLAQIMKETQQPDPPPDYVTCDGDKYRCKFCYTVSSTEPIAQRHYQEKHGERYLFCYACGATFRSRTNLYKHEKFNCQSSDIALVLRARALFLGRMGRSRARPFMLSQREKPRKRFPCTECSATFANKASLEPHLRMHRGERPFRCSNCPRAYTSYIAMKHHMKKHSSIQFICDYCGRVFKEKGKLVVHLASHEHVKRYSCKECPKRYSTKSDLTVHVIRDHRNLPLPFDCKICPMRFARMSTLKHHMKKNHGMVIITSRMFARQLPTITEQEIVTQLQQAIIVLKNSVSSHSNVQKEHYES